MTADQQVIKLWAGGYSPLQIALRLSITVSHVNSILTPTLENHSCDFGLMPAYEYQYDVAR